VSGFPPHGNFNDKSRVGVGVGVGVGVARNMAVEEGVVHRAQRRRREASPEQREEMSIAGMLGGACREAQ
jgi:hypothetical protein